MRQSDRLLAIALLLGTVFASAQAEDANNRPQGALVDALGDALPPGAVARLGTSRLCQADVYFFQFSPDGTKLATVTGRGKLQIWDVKSGKETVSWNVPRFNVYSPTFALLAFSPDGRQLALACADNVLRIWEPKTGRQITDFKIERTLALAYSPNGKVLATMSIRAFGKNDLVWHESSSSVC